MASVFHSSQTDDFDCLVKNTYSCKAEAACILYIDKWQRYKIINKKIISWFKSPSVINVLQKWSYIIYMVCNIKFSNQSIGAIIAKALN